MNNYYYTSVFAVSRIFYHSHFIMVSVINCDGTKNERLKNVLYATFTLLRLLLMFVLENALSLITFVLTIGLYYYESKWQFHTKLTNLESRTMDNTYNKKNENNESMKKERISILSQNLWIHYFAPSPQKDVRLRAFILHLKSLEKGNKLYDILILQEIFAIRFGLFIRGTHLIYLIKELNKLGYIYHTNPNGILPYFGQNGGIMIFSLYPLYSYSININSFSKRDEYVLRKGYAIATCKINDKYNILLGTTHCSPYRTHTVLSQIKQFRDELNKQIKLFIEKQNNTNCNSSKNENNNDGSDNNNSTFLLDIIVGGDFNTYTKRREKGLISMFNEINMKSVWSMNKFENRKCVTYRKPFLKTKDVFKSYFSFELIKLPSLSHIKNYNKGQCIDHILTNINQDRIENVSAVDTRYDDVFVSDHLGVVIEIKIPQSTGTLK